MARSKDDSGTGAGGESAGGRGAGGESAGGRGAGGESAGGRGAGGRSAGGAGAKGGGTRGRGADAADAPSGKGGDKAERRGLRRRISERAMRVPFLRRRYVKRVIKYIDKSKEKGRRLPPEMVELSRFLSRVPKDQRAQKFEEALVAQQELETGDQPFNRDMRRAAYNQQRRSGKSANGYRPGLAPKSQQPVRRPSKPR